jgi:hypothetical protein
MAERPVVLPPASIEGRAGEWFQDFYLSYVLETKGLPVAAHPDST